MLEDWLWACSLSWAVLCHDGAHLVATPCPVSASSQVGAARGGGRAPWAGLPRLFPLLGERLDCTRAVSLSAFFVLAVADTWSGSRFVQKVLEFQFSLPTSWKQILNIFPVLFAFYKNQFSFLVFITK